MIENPMLQVLLMGLGATALMDLWSLLQRCVKQPAPDYALVGRWVAYWPRGVWAHAAIGKTPPVAGERPLGWLVHYVTGIAFAALLAAVAGPEWLSDPTLSLALSVGLATVAAPWLLMQPAWGAGLAASRTPTPWKNRIRSLMNHAVFGVGLYLSAAVLAAHG